MDFKFHSKNFLKLFVSLIVILVLLEGISFLLLSWNRFYQFVLPIVIESKFPDAQITKLKIDKAKFNLSDQFIWTNVEAELHIKNEKYALKLTRVDLRRLGHFLLKRDGAHIMVSARSFSSEKIDVNFCDFDFSLNQENSQTIIIDGKIFINEAEVAGYRFNDTQINVSGNNYRLNTELLKSSFYGGILSGQVFAENQKGFPFQMDLKFDHINTELLDEIYKELYSNFRGLITGFLHLDGNSQHLNSMTLDMRADEGAKIRAWVIGWLIEFVPSYKVILSKELKDMIQQNNFLTTEYLNVKIQNINQKIIQAEAKMKIQKYNLQPNYSFDINIDRDLLELILGVEHFLKTGGLNGLR
ncbi:MAG: hypothetical protein KBD53_04035 [Candidatus Omnitrophica bacterium]|nr:hypothetical protein [Candidatus Omnitrophota bacterium]